MSREQSLEALLEVAGEWLARDEAEALFEAIGLGQLLEDAVLAEEVILAGDSFHPVARFFVPDSDEHAYIQRVLARRR